MRMARKIVLSGKQETEPTRLVHSKLFWLGRATFLPQTSKTRNSADLLDWTKCRSFIRPASPTASIGINKQLCSFSSQPLHHSRGIVRAMLRNKALSHFRGVLCDALTVLKPDAKSGVMDRKPCRRVDVPACLPQC